MLIAGARGWGWSSAGIHLPSMHKAWVQPLHKHAQGMGVHACNPSPQEVEQELKLKVTKGYTLLEQLGYKRPSLKSKRINKTS